MANLKSNGNQNSLCIKTFQIGNMSDNPDPATGFIHSHAYYFHQLDENIRHNEKVIQDPSPK